MYNFKNQDLEISCNEEENPIIEDIAFALCYKFEMRCPYKDCSVGNDEIYLSELSFQNHYILYHQLRDMNGKIKSKWKCPECSSQSQSWYNFLAHITTHNKLCNRPWICRLNKKNNKNEICAKSCSTKHNLIKHINAVHKVNVIKHHAKFLNNDHKNKIIKRNHHQTDQIHRNDDHQNHILPNIVAQLPPKMLLSSPNILINPMNHSYTININKSKRKLRPNIEAINKRSRMEFMTNPHQSHLDPPRKKIRNNKDDNDNIQSQYNFLNTMYQAAMYIERNEQ